MSVARREEIRIAVLQEKAHVKRARESWKKTTDTAEKQRAQKQREQERGAGGRQAGRGEPPCSRGAMELNPTAVCTYYQKRNNSELGALLWLLLSEPTSH